MSLEVWIAYIIACIVVAIVPGPTVTLIVANSVRHGTRAGLANIAGTQLGVSFALVVLVAGLASVMKFVADWFDVLRIIGAAYLVWLGVKLWLSDGKIMAGEAKPARGGFFLQGFLVAVTNPKILLFFGAFIPQFVDPSANALMQLTVLGVTFMTVATFLDACYAVTAGRAAKWLSQSHVKLVERISGALLIGGGLWIAFSRR